MTNDDHTPQKHPLIPCNHRWQLDHDTVSVSVCCTAGFRRDFLGSEGPLIFGARRNPAEPLWLARFVPQPRPQQVGLALGWHCAKLGQWYMSG